VVHIVLHRKILIRVEGMNEKGDAFVNLGKGKNVALWLLD